MSHLFLCFQVSKVSEKFSFRGELGRLQEMKQTKELLHSVLEGSASQQHFVFLKEPQDTKCEMEEKRRASVKPCGDKSGTMQKEQDPKKNGLAEV